MTPHRWKEVKALLAEALEVDGEGRTALLAAAEPELAREVAAFLELDTALGDFIERPAFDVHPQDDPAVRVGQRLGPYRLDREIGAGGMGAVYQASRADQEYEQSVAIKVLKRGLDTEEVIHRFRAERQILAGLEHPNVARLLDGGTTPDGRPYLVMEHVEGRPIDLWCAERGLGVDERLELFLAVCEAVRYAHRNLIVHRDLKPSNILVSADGTPKLLDFGIARLLDPQGAAALPTVGAWRFLTPEYASPEQVAGEPITTATDVYSLGVLLYQLLADRRPYDLGERSARGLAAALATGEPPRPSTVAPPERRRRLTGDLDNIALTALHRDPARRYGSAGELADDVRRHLEGLPVRATPDRWTYRANKFVRRHRLGVGVAASVAVMLVVFSVVALSLQAIADAQREVAELETGRAERVTDLLEEILGLADPDQAGSETMTVQDALIRGRDRIVQKEEDPLTRASLLQTIGGVLLHMRDTQEAKPTLREALRLRQEVLGNDAPEVAETLSSLANVFRLERKGTVAEKLLCQALTILNESLPSDHPKVLAIRNNLGTLYNDLGEYEKAEPIHQTLLEVRRHAAGTSEGRRDLASTLHNLATSQLRLRRPAEALPLFEEATEIRSTLEEAATEIAGSLNGAGTCLQEENRFQEALQRFERAEKTLRDTNPNHEDLFKTLNNKALVLDDLGREAEAEVALRDARSRSPNTTTLTFNLAAVLVKEGKLDEAEELVNSLRPGAARMPLWRQAELDSLQGCILAGHGDFVAAEPILLDAYERMAQDPKVVPRNLREAAARVVRLYEAWGKEAEAAKWRERMGETPEPPSPTAL